MVFDIETANFFTDPDVGWQNFAALKISGVGIYSYNEDSYRFFGEHELAEAVRLLSAADLLIGFGISRYDIPALNHAAGRLAAPVNFFEKTRVDLLDEIELVTGRRISLNRLAQANLGEGKLAHDGSHAAEMYRRGAWEELKTYCLKDVELTKRLYDRYRAEKYFLIPNQLTGGTDKVQFSGLAGILESTLGI